MTTQIPRNVTVSIVNHGHCAMIRELLNQLSEKCTTVARVVLTNNIPSVLDPQAGEFPFEIVTIENAVPKGFGANHNAAFLKCETDYFCVLNPDIQILDDPFPMLTGSKVPQDIGIAAPQVINSDGDLEDSARRFPTPTTLLGKLLFNRRGEFNGEFVDGLMFPDWAAGMFLVLKVDFFEKLNGFDEDYFLYYEDIDLSLRAWKAEKKVAVFQDAVVVHNAQRDSHKNLKLFLIHLKSIVIFFAKHLFRFPR